MNSLQETVAILRDVMKCQCGADSLAVVTVSNPLTGEDVRSEPLCEECLKAEMPGTFLTDTDYKILKTNTH